MGNVALICDGDAVSRKSAFHQSHAGGSPVEMSAQGGPTCSENSSRLANDPSASTKVRCCGFEEGPSGIFSSGKRRRGASEAGCARSARATEFALTRRDLCCDTCLTNFQR